MKPWDHPVLKEHELDVVGAVFGLKYVAGGVPDGLVELYVEDDENWHYKVTFNRVWLNDLEGVVAKAKSDFKM